MTRLTLLGAVIALAHAAPALAWLGGDAASVEIDRLHLKATLDTASAATHTRYELHTPSGTVVTQFVSPAGRVFAVAWEGPAMPDLKQVLSDYFPRYVAASGSQGPGKRVVEAPDFVVQSSGHMRAFFGRAYLPESLPQGVSLDDIR